MAVTKQKQPGKKPRKGGVSHKKVISTERWDIDRSFLSFQEVVPDPLQFADCSIGLSLTHLPVLLTIAVPVATLLIALGSLWLLAIPFLSLQVVAIFLCLQEPQGASLLLHVMTILAVSLSLFLLGNLLFLSWFHLFFYALCVGSYIGINILLHLTLDSVVEDDKETAVTLEVALMKLFPSVCSLLISWTLYSAIPAPISHYFITIYLLAVFACFCYPHRSSFAGPMHRDILLSYDNSVIVSLAEASLAFGCLVAFPVLLALLSSSDLTFEQNMLHLLCNEALIFLVLPQLPCSELLAFADLERKKVESTWRFVGVVLAGVSVVCSYFVLDSSQTLLHSQLLLFFVATTVLGYVVLYHQNRKITSIALVFCTGVTLLQLCTLQIDYDSPEDTAAESLHQLLATLLTLGLFCAIISKSPHKNLIGLPILAFCFTWANFAQFLVNCGVMNPVLAQILTLTIYFLINALYRCDKERMSEPFVLLILSLLASLSLDLIVSNSNSNSTVNKSSTAFRLLTTMPSVALLQAPVLLPDLFYSKLSDDGVVGTLWKTVSLSVVSIFIHLFLGGFQLSSAVYSLLTGYTPSFTSSIGLLLVLLCVAALQIWFHRLDSSLWVAMTFILSGIGILIAVFEPEIFSVRVCLSVGLLLFFLLWLLLVTGIPSVTTRSAEVMGVTALLSGFCFGSVAALILIPTSLKFILLFLVYVAICTSSAFVLLAIWRLWLSQEHIQSASQIFNCIVAGSIVELCLCMYLEMSANVVLEAFQTWISPAYPCTLVFLACFAVDSLVIKWYQHKLVTKYAHQKLPIAIQRTEKVFTTLSLLLALLASPKHLLSLWVPMVLTLLYRPEMKPWMSKQSATALSFAPMMTAYSVVGLIVSLLENYFFTVAPAHLTTWQSTCIILEPILLVFALYCHLSVVVYLWRGFIKKDASFHTLILAVPVGLVLGVFGCSFTASLYGLSSTVFVLFAMWNELPFSQ